MITSIEVVPPPGASFSGLTLPVLGASEDDPIVVRNIEGLGPVDAELNSKGYGQIDGEFYVGSRIGKRNIVLTLGLNDPELGRTLLYAYFMTKMGVALRINLDGSPPFDQPLYINGYVETNHPNHFSQDPEQQISIICPKPNLHRAEIEVAGVSGGDPDSVEIEYHGNMITGFDFTMDVPDAGYSGHLWLEWKTGELTLPWRHFHFVNATLVGGTTLHWSSVAGKKAAELLPVNPDWPYNSLLGTMGNDASFWLTLWPGTNWFRVRTEEGTGETGDGAEFDWTLRYSDQFGGI